MNYFVTSVYIPSWFCFLETSSGTFPLFPLDLLIATFLLGLYSLFLSFHIANLCEFTQVHDFICNIYIENHSYNFDLLHV